MRLIGNGRPFLWEYMQTIDSALQFIDPLPHELIEGYRKAYLAVRDSRKYPRWKFMLPCVVRLECLSPVFYSDPTSVFMSETVLLYSWCRWIF